MIYIIIPLLCIVTFFLWAAIHELSHLFAAKKLADALLIRMRLYPHMYKDTLRFASVSWRPRKEYSDKAAAMISLAPRIPDLIAALVFPVGAFFSGYVAVAWFILFGAGLVDLMRGSIGSSVYSDLMKASIKLHINPWTLRYAGFGAALLSTTSYFILRFAV